MSVLKMNLEDQVVSLELSKKLNEIGVNQESIFVWEYLNDKAYAVKFKTFAVVDTEHFKIYSAFTVAEIGEMLPAFIDTKQNEPFNMFNLVLEKRTAKNIQYIARYVCDSMPGEDIDNPFFKIPSDIKSYDEKLSDCLAKIFIQLIQNGLMEVPK